MQISLVQPIIGQDEISAVTAVLESGKLTAGDNVREFEKLFADYCGATHAIAVNNGTSALHASLLAADIGFGDEVIVPAFSFFSTASVVSMTGAKPVFVDVHERTFNIDPLKVENNISPKTKAIIGVHLFGQPFDVPGIQHICESHNLMLLEDAAQAHGAMWNGEKTGGFGQFGCFSFSAAKNMTTGEGGMVTTREKVLAERLRLLINHGQSEKLLHTRMGYNYRMTDIAAAMGLIQLKKLEKFNNRRRKNAEFYDTHIKVKGLLTPSVLPRMYHVYNQYVIRITGEFPMKRTEFIEYLKAKGIESGVSYPLPLHHQPVYAVANAPDSCPISTSLSSSVLSIPVHPMLDQKELAYICDVINQVK